VDEPPRDSLYRRFACGVAAATGTHAAFLGACVLIVAWALTGPFFHFSDTWQLVINTGTTIVTFLMVFLIQSTQNRDAKAIHLKLDELIRSQQRARNVFASLEHATDDELREFEEEFALLRKRGVERRAAVKHAAEAAADD
jgi:low affinity Fe/Cu permease